MSDSFHLSVLKPSLTTGVHRGPDSSLSRPSLSISLLVASLLAYTVTLNDPLLSISLLASLLAYTVVRDPEQSFVVNIFASSFTTGLHRGP
jgi:hypothetical protein